MKWFNPKKRAIIVQFPPPNIKIRLKKLFFNKILGIRAILNTYTRIDGETSSKTQKHP